MEGDPGISGRDPELDPVASDPTGFNRRVSQLRRAGHERDDDAALSVAFGEAVATVEVEQSSGSSKDQ